MYRGQAIYILRSSMLKGIRTSSPEELFTNFEVFPASTRATLVPVLAYVPYTLATSSRATSMAPSPALSLSNTAQLAVPLTNHAATSSASTESPAAMLMSWIVHYIRKGTTKRLQFRHSVDTLLARGSFLRWRLLTISSEEMIHFISPWEKRPALRRLEELRITP